MTSAAKLLELAAKAPTIEFWIDSQYHNCINIKSKSGVTITMACADTMENAYLAELICECSPETIMALAKDAMRLAEAERMLGDLALFMLQDDRETMREWAKGVTIDFCEGRPRIRIDAAISGEAK